MKFARIPLRLAAGLLATLVPLSGSAASWWDEKGYGSARAQATSFAVDLIEGMATNKGIAVRLGPANEGVFIFDTELLRATSAWTGGSLDSFNDFFPGTPLPTIPPNDARCYFGAYVSAPGWSKGESFIDPRPPAGSRESNPHRVPFGPLPREWAKYRGMYLHNDLAVFAYTIGAAALLESPALEEVRERSLLTRTFNVLTPGDASSLLVADVPAGAIPRIKNGMVEFAGEANRDSSRTVIGVRNMPAGGTFVIQGTRIELKLPPFAAGQKFKVVYARGADTELSDLYDAIEAAAEPEDLQPLTHGGAPQWPQTEKSKVTLGKDDGTSPYVVDSFAVPLENTNQSIVDIRGIDFFKDGRIAFCTRSGDVWIGKVIAGKPETIEWKRFAAGLDHPAGLRIVDDQIYVLGRDQITRLHDLNNDGEADFYECFNNDFQASGNMDNPMGGLEMDSNGNFYFSQGAPKPHPRTGDGARPDHYGCLLRVSGSGQKMDVFASSTQLFGGIGIGIGPNDEISIGLAEVSEIDIGEIYYVKEGDLMNVAHDSMAPGSKASRLCWIPRGWGMGHGRQIWVTGDRWGPLQSTMLYLPYSSSTLCGVLQESVGETRQGGTFQFPVSFDETVHCARFSPIDGQLYVAGETRIAQSGSKDAAIQRVRYTGKPVTLPNALEVNSQGITIGFTNPVDLSSLNNPKNYSVEQFNYRRVGDHLKEYKLSDPAQEGHDVVEIKAVLVAPDHKSVFLEISGLRPVMQMKIRMSLKGAKGEPMPSEIGNTINVVPKGEAPKWVNFGVGSQF